MATRRLRAFKRWMKTHRVEYSNALDFTDNPNQGISVISLRELKEGDVVASIPKSSCLTIKTTAACRLIEAAGLDGYLGLSVAIMYELSLDQASPWAGYLQLLPDKECLPLVWTLQEIDSFLCGTELHKIVKEDKGLMYDDWKENILPLLDSEILKLNPKFFDLDHYFAARSLISSRSFEIDDYHGFGMVPLADLFNHKTGAEDVHFTLVSSSYKSESESDSDENDNGGDDPSTQILHSRKREMSTALAGGTDDFSGSDLESSLTLGDDPMVLEMIMVRDVKAGAEVFNTYGLVGNAALLHRYGFTEPDNSYDIVNIDLELILRWSLSLFSDRHSRARLSFWKRLNYSGCVSQNAEYFEISPDGEPQIELLILLYIILLPEDSYHKLDIAVSTGGDFEGSIRTSLSNKRNSTFEKASEISKEMLLTKHVGESLSSLADIRGRLYGSNSIEDDMEALKMCCCIRERKLYHSLTLRVAERRILEKLKIYAAAASQSFRTANRTSLRKRLKAA